MWYWPNLDLFGGTGVQELRGEAVGKVIDGTPVCVAGVAYDSEQQIGRVLGPIRYRPRRFFDYHTPDELRGGQPGGVPGVYCAGPYSRRPDRLLPLYGALITLFENTASSTRPGYTTWERRGSTSIGASVWKGAGCRECASVRGPR